MARSETQQVKEQLQKSERPLICFKKQWNPDTLSSALGLYLILQRLGKKPELVCEGFKATQNLHFLPQLNAVRPEISSLRKFVISVDTSKNKVGELSYEAKDGFLHIYLAPRSGNFESRHIKTRATDYQHDLIITVDTPDIDSLGKMSEEASDFFFHTPILNIDHSPANEHYGQINHVDITATSTGEMVFMLAKELDHAVDEELATAMLTGFIAKTRSFKVGSLTPRALSLASELVSLGAKRDTIVSSLYRTKDIPTLKLWGRALARMKYDHTHRIVSTVLTRQDFALAGTSDDALTGVIDELILSSPDAETIVLLYEQDEHICCVIRNDVRKNADQLASKWKGEGDKIQSTCFLKEIPLQQAEKEVLSHVRESLARA